MRYKIILFLIALIFIFVTNSFAYVIIAVEKGSVFYESKNDKVTEDKGMNKIYYEVDEENKTVTRTKVVVLKSNEVIPDNTVYTIISPDSQESIVSGEKVIHAIGQPGLNAYELLTIGKDYVMSSKSTGDYVIVFNCKITERSDIPDK